MSWGLFNGAMMAGLIGVTLPVLVHLLSKRRYDVVHWGAMQFLELGRNTRRKIKLEEFWLMLLRIGLIAILVLGLSRPWISGGWIGNYFGRQNRAITLIIDSSLSMGWQGGKRQPHEAALRWSKELLGSLHSGDTISLWELRDVPRPIIEAPTGDFAAVRRALDEIPPPAGSSVIPDAVIRGMKNLLTAEQTDQQVIVVTDLQAQGWNADDPPRWKLVDEIRSQSEVQPRIAIIDVSQSEGTPMNFALDPIERSRVITATELPLRIKTNLRYFGEQPSKPRSVYLEVNGQRLANTSLMAPSLSAGGVFPIEFEHRFDSPGSYVLAVAIENDELPGDDRSSAVVEVTSQLNVLIVDGDPNSIPVKSESFFCQAALSASGNTQPLVRSRVVPLDALTPVELKTAAVVVMANVPTVTAAQALAIKEFVERGGGIWWALGDKVQANDLSARLWDRGLGLLPGKPESIETYAVNPPVGIDIASLDLPFLSNFRTDPQSDLGTVRFDRSWKIILPETSNLPENLKQSIVGASLNNSSPWIVVREFGLGRVLMSTTPIDADWSTLPGKQSFVPWLHEILFHLAGGTVSTRNVKLGEPILYPVENRDLEGLEFISPSGDRYPAEKEERGQRVFARLNETMAPGIYRLTDGGDFDEPFVVDFERTESDLTPLTEELQGMIAGDDRLRFIRTLDEWEGGLASRDSPTEIWPLLLFAVLGILVGEIVMTRRLVQGGHVHLEDGPRLVRSE